MTGEGPARACFECGARPRLKGPLARVSARQVATVVHVPTGWVPLNTRPPLSRDIVSGFVTQAPMSWHGKVEQTMVLGSWSVSAVVIDAQQPPPWTSVAGRVWFTAVWRRSVYFGSSSMPWACCSGGHRSAAVWPDPGRLGVVRPILVLWGGRRLVRSVFGGAGAGHSPRSPDLGIYGERWPP